MKRTIMESFECVGTVNGSNSGANEKTDENGNENRIVIAFPPACMIYAAFGYSNPWNRKSSVDVVKEQLSASSCCHFRAIYKRMTLMILDDTQMHMCTEARRGKYAIMESFECVGTVNGSNSGANEKTDENGNENRIVIAFPPACMIYAAFGYSNPWNRKSSVDVVV
ncbi:hypothetical protein M513_10936 [Trichuris suis]|uniref:Uncharacterized protein n=1 Tax=Trichuris suis TaxID=68888 RepID=A0A085LTC6_9BILA|nr:hypothetical protein M513_10936 [Trichuris suis]